MRLTVRLLVVMASALVAPALLAADRPAAPAQPPGTMSTQLRDWTGDWDGIEKRRTLRVLVVPNKTNYFVEKGVQRGITYDTFRLFEEETNKRLKTRALKFHVVFIPVPREELLTALVKGRGDVAAANLTVTDARDKLVDFTSPTLENVSEVILSSPKAASLASAEDLSGREVYVRKSSSYWEHLVELNARLARAGKAPVKLREAPDDLEDEDLMEMLEVNLVDHLVIDSHKAAFWSKVYRKVKVNEGAAVATGGRVAWALREGSPLLKAQLDAFIAKHRDGTFGRSVMKRYLNDPRRLKAATDDAEMRKYRQVVELFRKYAGRYEMDHLLMMAQGFQESRLDQGAKSPVGAIGVMQVMPATGKDLAVGDIAQLEPNIHAGVKYMRFMMNTFYAKEPMTDLDKALFTFASYNCGPGRMKGLRAEAAKRGLDPNRWFRHVELVTADKIGAETVTYVSNIYKYYMAYKLVAEQEAERARAREEATKATG
ncbi:MAG: lytic transglycosylase F [Betaproteobacteria bacterium]|nr:lytic transglycosylase F [Betaproteobacteria bacterium]